MRVVLDTNVLLAGVATHGLCENVVALTLRDHTLVLSDHTLNEFKEHYIDKFKATTEQALVAEKTLRSQCEVIEPAYVDASTCKDSDDLPVLGTAAAGKAEYLVTGDHGLIDIDSFAGTSIVSPRVFYELIRDKS